MVGVSTAKQLTGAVMQQFSVKGTGSALPVVYGENAGYAEQTHPFEAHLTRRIG